MRSVFGRLELETRVGHRLDFRTPVWDRPQFESGGDPAQWDGGSSKVAVHRARAFFGSTSPSTTWFRATNCRCGFTRSLRGFIGSRRSSTPTGMLPYMLMATVGSRGRVDGLPVQPGLVMMPQTEPQP